MTSAEQRQRIEENKRKAKERLTAAKGSPLRKTKAGKDVSRGPDTRSGSHSSNTAERDAKQASTPVKSKPRGNANSNKISCAVCLGDIIDGKHEAIFCEGKCHRGCASVSQELLTVLTASEEPLDSWYYIFMSIMKQTIPNSVIRTKRNLPWLSKSIIQSICRRNKLFKQVKRTGDFTKYKRARNRTLESLRL